MKLARYFFLLFVGVCVVFFGTYTVVSSQSKPATLLSPIGKMPSQEVEAVSGYDPGLDTVVKDSLKGTSGTYGIVIKNLRTNKTFQYNETKVFPSASLYKLWIMAVTEEQLEKGMLHENQVLTADIPKLNDMFKIASESAERTDGTVSLSVTNALTKMITISDNYAALLLSSKIRLSNVDAFLDTYGLSGSAIGQPPTTTPLDVAVFYEKLYARTLISQQASEKMLTLLKQQQINDRIPKYLPDGIDVAHKTGELDGVKHDAGIVFAPFGDYIIVLMSDSQDPLGAAAREALVSKNVYEYFAKRQL